MDGSVVKEDLERKGSHHEKVLPARAWPDRPFGERMGGEKLSQYIMTTQQKMSFRDFLLDFFVRFWFWGGFCVEGEMRGWIGIEFVEIEILCKSVKENHLNDYLYAAKSLGLFVDA